MTTLANSIKIDVDGREIEIREIHPGIWNAFDGEDRIAIAVQLEDGWWQGCRIDDPQWSSPRKHFYEGGGAIAATRRLLVS